VSAATARSVRRAVPGALPPGLWALGPATLSLRDVRVEAAGQPSVWTDDPPAVAWLGLEGDDLLVFGPYGDTQAMPALLDELREVARETGRRCLVVAVRNDEVERFELVQRYGFVLIEARLGALSAGDADLRHEQRWVGEIAARDELVLALDVTHG